MSFRFVLLVAVLYASPACAHSWYDTRCCSGSDCHPVSCLDLKRGAGGSVTFLPTGVTFFRENVLPSQDAQCHICTSRPQTNTGYGYCAYIPRGGGEAS